MNAGEFLNALEGRRIVERASKAAAVPVSVHVVEGGQETEWVYGFGQCLACRRACSWDAGRAACDASRQQASTRAVRRSKAVPFVCHLGFACVSMRAQEGAPYVLTFGPYSPMYERNELGIEAAEGLEALGMARIDGPEALAADIQISPAEAVIEIAQWTADTLEQAYVRLSAEGAEQGEAPPEAGGAAPAIVLAATGEGAPFDPAPVALALAANQGSKAKGLLLSALEEGRGGRKSNAQAALQARAVALAGAVIEAAARAGMDPAGAWGAWPEFLERLEAAANAGGAAGAIMEVLKPMRKKAVRQAAGANAMEEFHRIVLARLHEPVRLEEVAAAMGEQPTAITHRLQRTFGLSYSEYVARLRVGEAKNLLRNTELRIAEIAGRVGIGDTSNFGRVFRNVEGLSPSEYRRRFGRR